MSNQGEVYDNVEGILAKLYVLRDSLLVSCIRKSPTQI